MSFVEQLRQRASAAGKRILFPEAADARVLTAIAELASTGIVKPVVLPGGRSIPGAVEHLEPPDEQTRDEMVARIRVGVGGREMPESEAAELSVRPIWMAAALLAMGRVDGVVAGAAHTTAEVIRASLRLVGGIRGSLVSGAFYMVLPNDSLGTEVLTFADCAVVAQPDSGQLAAIASAAARERRVVVGDEPRVALLSYSTHGSAGGESVARVREAVRILRQLEPGLAVDGELQGDAALVPEISSRKAPGGVLGGRANVLIFPSLDAGNIAYKLVQRIAGAQAIGPILQGLARPCNDLSRGTASDDIINVAAITALKGV